MKVLGITSTGWSPSYIVEITHDEIKTAFEKAYGDSALKEFKVGDTVDLREIPRQRERIVQATKSMQDAYRDFVKAAPVMADLARLIERTGPLESIAQATEGTPS